MLRYLRLRCFACSQPIPLWWNAWAARRAISTRQAERLRRSSSTPTAGGVATSRAPPSGEIRSRRVASGSAQRSATTSLSNGASDTFASAPSAASAGRAKHLPGRFNRLTVELGFLVALYHYVLAEAIHIYLTYLLHSHRLGIGDMGSWLGTAGVPADGFLNVGPVVYGLQLSPRLFLNHLVANACMYPSIPLQLRFCIATAPIVRAPFQVIGRLLGVPKRASVPKAPRSSPG
ncbi:hypothetical protein LSCM1_07156 [Leishmania martiniquensis]|uniref:Uncharacterized protein n=1 Tax=Leishmania martiniquensis TaxID=1580590 RepID=A0A836HKF0_9TRYP|nr:hypothetical protein LSCM1_07156 [Leishmania martiniquensis]